MTVTFISEFNLYLSVLPASSFCRNYLQTFSQKLLKRKDKLIIAISLLCQADFPVILAAQLLFVFLVLREEFAFLFQTFSRNDPPAQKKKKKKEKEEEIKLLFKWRYLSRFSYFPTIFIF